jgi:ABC-type uncharacterized transport system permease subunit
VVVVVCLIAMFVFEMFHSPPCNLDYSTCSGSELAAHIGVNAIWATVMGISTGIALAAVMGLLVESLDERRSKATSGPLVRTVLGIAALVIIFVVVLVRFQFVSS